MITANGHRELARALGKALALIKNEDLSKTAYNTCRDSIIAELKADNPKFSESKFKAAILTASTER